MERGWGLSAEKGPCAPREWVAKQHSDRTGAPKEDVLNELKAFAMEVKGLEFSMYSTKESLAQQGGYGFALKGSTT